MDITWHLHGFAGLRIHYPIHNSPKNMTGDCCKSFHFQFISSTNYYMEPFFHEAAGLTF